VRVPPDIDRLKRADRGAALRWRDAMRASMVWAFGAGYRVRGLAGDLRADGTVWYHLDRGGG
jgi:predicted GNAT superfamily acetyltransferase